MPREYTIGRLAKHAGVPTTTVRYYERVGLLEPEHRSGGNYRLYGTESLRKLKFIRAAQQTGFTLDDVKTLLGKGEDCPCCGDVRQLIEDRLSDISARLRDLRQVQRVLQKSLAECRASESDQRCHVLQKLNR